MGLFGLTKKDLLDEDEKTNETNIPTNRIRYEDEDENDEYYEENTRSTESKNYLIKLLLPSDQYGTEFLLYYVGENDTIVRNSKFAKSFDNFNIARSVSNDITERYKRSGIWVPSRVIVDKYQ